MITEVIAKFEVEIVVQKQKFVSVEDVILECNACAGKRSMFQMYGAKINRADSKYAYIRTFITFGVRSDSIKSIFNLKEALPSWILSINFF